MGNVLLAELQVQVLVVLPVQKSQFQCWLRFTTEISNTFPIFERFYPILANKISEPQSNLGPKAGFLPKFAVFAVLFCWHRLSNKTLLD